MSATIVNLAEMTDEDWNNEFWQEKS